MQAFLDLIERDLFHTHMKRLVSSKLYFTLDANWLLSCIMNVTLLIQLESGLRWKGIPELFAITILIHDFVDQ